jgi:DNA gyrase subunit A
VVDDEDDIIMISTDGVVIRIRACDISIMGRYSKGVRLMKVSEEGKVVAFTRTEHEEDAEISEVEQASAEDIAQAAEEEANEVLTEDEAPDDEDAVDDGNDDDE